MDAYTRGLVAILPALNEEEALPLVISGLQSAGVKKIVVIDGGSTDSTVAIAKKLGASVIVQEGRGKGMAFQTFLRKHPLEANAKYVMLDADATYDAGEIGLFANGLDDADVVCGTRSLYIHDLRSLLHVIGGFFISLLASALFLRWNPDITSGYWGFRGSALKKMIITADNFDLEANIFAQSAKKGLKAVCVPISYSKRVGKSKLSSLDALRIVPRLIAERLSG